MDNRRCTYPVCDCPVSFPKGYKPSDATECPNPNPFADRWQEGSRYPIRKRKRWFDRHRPLPWWVWFMLLMCIGEVAIFFGLIARDIARVHGWTQ